MGSINNLGSTLNSINQSLLNEIGSSQSGTSGAPSSATSSTDSVNFSEVGQLFQQLSQLQTTDPAEFTQVVTDAANKLTAAAQQDTDPAQANFLNNLASKFQDAAQTGNLSAFEQQPSTSSSTPAYQGRGHHHHHHGGGSSSGSSTATQFSPSTTTPATPSS